MLDPCCQQNRRHWSIKIQIQRAIKIERLVQIENCFLQNEEGIQLA